MPSPRIIYAAPGVIADDFEQAVGCWIHPAMTPVPRVDNSGDGIGLAPPPRHLSPANRARPNIARSSQREDKHESGDKFHPEGGFRAETGLKHAKIKTHRAENRTRCALGKSLCCCFLSLLKAAGLFQSPAWPKNPSEPTTDLIGPEPLERVHDLFSVATSSFEMPRPCSTVLTCF